MKNFFLLISFVVAISFPFITQATYIPFGTQCFPDDNISDKTCPFCPTDGATTLHLKWDLSNSFTNTNKYPVNCRLNCTNGAGLPCKSYSYKDNTDFATSSPTGIKLASKDNILIANHSFLNSLDGNVYQVACVQIRTSLSDSTVKSSPKMSITGCSASCELPFKTILDNLNSGKKVVITEKSFASWYGPEDEEDCSQNLWGQKCTNGEKGSGDFNDVMFKAIVPMQLCQVLPDEKISSFVEPDLFMPNLIEKLNQYEPVRLGVYFAYNKYHAVLALSTSLKSVEDFNNLKDGEPFYIDVFDSNTSMRPGDGVITLDCKKSPVRILLFNHKGITCVASDYYDPDKNFYLFSGNMSAPFIDCSESKRVRPKPAEWIKSNPPFFPNTDILFPGSRGVCVGITDFITKVACFGDFSGVDYHPNDGKILGKDCDANRKPIPPSTSWLEDKTKWLANILSVFN